ncbi:MAG TPA: hypothetical protein VGJ20_14765 [Xanthobacteraceae bacterium]|jgi:hypothetical protein
MNHILIDAVWAWLRRLNTKLDQLNGWQWFGVVLSIMWCFVLARYLRVEQLGGILKLDLCAVNGVDRSLQKYGYQPAFDSCHTVAFWLLKAPFYCVVMLAFAWLATWGIIATARWITRGNRT